MLKEYLTRQGFVVRVADGGTAMREALATSVPDVVLLDITMPGESGLALARYLREHVDVGIIMVTASDEVVERIVGLEVGADDYIAKPFDPRELLARMRSLLRRLSAVPDKTVPYAPRENGAHRLPVGDCQLDVDARRLLGASGEDIPITAMEFDLLKLFVSRPNRVFSRDDILNLTQNRDWDPFDRSVDIRIARLRRKLERDPSKPTLIRTVRGAGYVYVPV